jgi:hypothetical protein
MDASIDAIVWEGSGSVWDETFELIRRETHGFSVLLNEIMNWIVSKVAEYRAKYLKVVAICERLRDPGGVHKLVFHYENIMLRYKTAYDCCRAYDLSL